MPRRFVLTALCVLSTACSDSHGPAEIPGSYYLRSIGGRSLPTNAEINTTIDILYHAATLTLAADGSCEIAERAQIQAQPPSDRITGCVWEKAAEEIVMEFEAGSVAQATVSGNQLTLQYSGSSEAWVFRK